MQVARESACAKGLGSARAARGQRRPNLGTVRALPPVAKLAAVDNRSPSCRKKIDTREIASQSGRPERCRLTVKLGSAVGQGAESSARAPAQSLV